MTKILVIHAKHLTERLQHMQRQLQDWPDSVEYITDADKPCDDTGHLARSVELSLALAGLLRKLHHEILVSITDDIISLYRALNEFGCVLQYTRSGRIAVTRGTQEQVSEFLEQREKQHH